MAAKVLSFNRSADQDTIHAAMTAIVSQFAGEAGNDNPDQQLVIAARAPVAIAAAFADLCAVLGMAPPAFVREALG